MEGGGKLDGMTLLVIGVVLLLFLKPQFLGGLFGGDPHAGDPTSTAQRPPAGSSRPPEPPAYSISGGNVSGKVTAANRDAVFSEAHRQCNSMGGNWNPALPSGLGGALSAEAFGPNYGRCEVTKSSKAGHELAQVAPDLMLVGADGTVTTRASYSAYLKAQGAGLLPDVAPLPDVTDWKARGL